MVHAGAEYPCSLYSRALPNKTVLPSFREGLAFSVKPREKCPIDPGVSPM